MDLSPYTGAKWKMNKPSYARAMELRDKDDNTKKVFDALPDNSKWKWLAYACAHEPKDSVQYIHQLSREAHV